MLTDNKSDKVNMRNALIDSRPEIYFNKMGEKHLVERRRKKIINCDSKISYKIKFHIKLFCLKQLKFSVTQLGVGGNKIL